MSENLQSTMYYCHHGAVQRHEVFMLPIQTLNKIQRNLLTGLLIYKLHQLLQDTYKPSIKYILDPPPTTTMECYMIDQKIVQFVLRDIVESGDYTLEGIAYYTKIPLDVILDAACGNFCQISITPWAKIAELYIQVKPEVSQRLFDKLLETKEHSKSSISLLLHES
jgi:hypothetical protein